MVGVGVPCADMVFEGRRRAVVEWWFRASSRVMDVVVGKLQRRSLIAWSVSSSPRAEGGERSRQRPSAL